MSKNQTFDVIIYDLCTNRITRFHMRNLPRRGGTFNAESMEQSALRATNTQLYGVAVVEHDEYRQGEVYQD